MGADKHEKRRKEKVPRHVRFYHWMLKSPAWRSLTPLARALYMQISARYMGTNNGAIPYSVREGQDELGVGRSSIHRAQQELTERGFIVVARRSLFSQKLKRAMEWRLTEFYCDVTQTPATKDFMKWQPTEICNSVPRAGPTVPLAGPHNPMGGTAVAETTRNSPTSGTVAAKWSVTVPWVGHL